MQPDVTSYPQILGWVMPGHSCAHFNGSCQAGESEKHLREVFEKARAHAATGQPTVLFFDDLESLAPKRDANRPHEARVVAQLLTLLDGAASDTGTH